MKENALSILSASINRTQDLAVGISNPLADKRLGLPSMADDKPKCQPACAKAEVEGFTRALIWKVRTAFSMTDALLSLNPTGYNWISPMCGCPWSKVGRHLWAANRFWWSSFLKSTEDLFESHILHISSLSSFSQGCPSFKTPNLKANLSKSFPSKVAHECHRHRNSDSILSKMRFIAYHAVWSPCSTGD